MAIYFHKNLVEEALKALRESPELSDISNELKIVWQQMKQVKYSNLVLESDNNIKMQKLQQAKELNGIIRQKYPVIDNMLAVADLLFQKRPVSRRSVGAVETNEYKCLEQDYYGILCHVLLKKRNIENIKEFIEKVD